jgi:hypothetical protein
MTTITAAEVQRFRTEALTKALHIIRTMHSRGRTLRDIAAELTRQGIAPARGLPGQTWNHRSVDVILRREAAQSRGRAA